MVNHKHDLKVAVSGISFGKNLTNEPRYQEKYAYVRRRCSICNHTQKIRLGRGKATWLGDIKEFYPNRVQTYDGHEHVYEHVHTFKIGSRDVKFDICVICGDVIRHSWHVKIRS